MNKVSLEFDDTYQIILDTNKHIQNKIAEMKHIINNYDISKSNKKDKSDLSIILYNLIASHVVLNTLEKSLINGNTEFEDDAIDPKNLTKEQENIIKKDNPENKTDKDIRFITNYNEHTENLFDF